MSLKTSAISEISEFTAFNSYQNPVTNVATITFSSISESNYSLKVVNLLGSVVMEQNGYSGEGTNTL